MGRGSYGVMCLKLIRVRVMNSFGEDAAGERRGSQALVRHADQTNPRTPLFVKKLAGLDTPRREWATPGSLDSIRGSRSTESRPRACPAILHNGLNVPA